MRTCASTIWLDGTKPFYFRLLDAAASSGRIRLLPSLNLWHVKKIPPQQLEHLTGKPAELAVRAMQYSSMKGENVLDLFGGSGSTLIGAEQTGRRAFLMEIDPLYADLVCDRFQRFTGLPAILERTGESPIPMKPREVTMR